MIEEFEKFIKAYDLTDSDIMLKYKHSYRVMELSYKYAKLLGFNEYDVKLAKLIGLLHDIGRFEQLRVYHTYNDTKSIDHADYGVKLLFEENLIERFWDNKDDYELIKFAIFNHNKYDFKETADERVNLHAKLIRDVDKLDIVYLEGKLDELSLRLDDSEIRKEIIETFKNEKAISYLDVTTNNEKLCMPFAYTYNIYNDICLKEFKNNLIEYYKAIGKNKVIDNIYDITIKYINERIDKIC